MATGNRHFKVVEGASTKSAGSSGEPLNLPIELMAVTGGVLVLFIIGALIYWKRMNREEVGG